MKTALVVFLSALVGFAVGVAFTVVCVVIAAGLRDNEIEKQNRGNYPKIPSNSQNEKI